MSRLWRILFLALLGVFVLGAALGIVAWRNRQELALLLLDEPPPPPPRPTPSRPVVPAPPPALPTPVQAPPSPRALSWEGLKAHPYEGRFFADLEAMRRMGDLSQTLLEAVKDLKDAAGLFPTASNRATFTARDYAQCSFKEPFQLRLAPEGAQVEFAAEPLLLRWWPARGLFEAALCRLLLAQESSGFAAAPEWFQAGASLHLTGLGPVYERRCLLQSQRPPLQLVGPLADGLPDSWLCGYWAFEALRSRKGEEAVKALLAATRGGDWKVALKAVGETPEEFEKGYRGWAADSLGRRTASRADFLEAQGLLRHRKEAEALAKLEAFEKERPLDLYAGEVSYYLNYARYRLGKYDEAARGFTALLMNAPYTTSCQSKAHFFTGRCYQLQGYGPMAAPEYHIAAFEPANPLLLRLATKRQESLR